MKFKERDVKRRVAADIAAIPPEERLYAMTPLDAHRVEPIVQRRFVARVGEHRRIRWLWVVLDERPGEDEGFLVVYDPRSECYGLASKGGAGRLGTLLGSYGAIRDAINGI